MSTEKALSKEQERHLRNILRRRERTRKLRGEGDQNNQDNRIIEEYIS